LIRLAEGRQASHALGSLTLSDGLLGIPEQTRLEAQTEVRVIRWPRLGDF
jgi:molybdopterin biosynthesis enzyme